jgi:type II secretory pathway pseudopilin PulG
LLGVAIHGMTVEPVLRWSSLRELTAADLRRTLADVLATDEMTPPISDNLKAEYLFCRASVQDTTAGWSGLPLRLMEYPERVQDGLNLVYANWLSQADRPRFRRLLAKGGKWELFELDRATPLNPKLLSPAQIEDRVGLAQQSMAASTISLLIPSVTAFIDSTDRERTRQAALVLGLALELYHREHGRFPAVLDAIVKAGYLKSIPADPFGKGEPFRYRLEADPKQGAILWSVWIDGIDQNGKIQVDPQREIGAGDKIFRIATPT